MRYTGHGLHGVALRDGLVANASQMDGLVRQNRQRLGEHRRDGVGRSREVDDRAANVGRMRAYSAGITPLNWTTPPGSTEVPIEKSSHLT